MGRVDPVALAFEQQPQRLEDVRLIVGDQNAGQRGVGPRQMASVDRLVIVSGQVQSSRNSPARNGRLLDARSGTWLSC